jgi:hypothetical protein
MTHFLSSRFHSLEALRSFVSTRWVQVSLGTSLSMWLALYLRTLDTGNIVGRNLYHQDTARLASYFGPQYLTALTTAQVMWSQASYFYDYVVRPVTAIANNVHNAIGAPVNNAIQSGYRWMEDMFSGRRYLALPDGQEQTNFDYPQQGHFQDDYPQNASGTSLVPHGTLNDDAPWYTQVWYESELPTRLHWLDNDQIYEARMNKTILPGSRPK